jgi:hypothetical protein
MSATWTASPVYGRSFLLGPAQRDVLTVALRMTRGGRRPELTLGRLASLTGRPVSSVHTALGRLRALGLLGVSARPGRRGGHRLWRVVGAPSSAHPLDMGKHRRAVARILRRFGVAVAAVPPERDRPPARPVPEPADVSPDVAPRREDHAAPAPSFHERMRRAGIGGWLDERKHDHARTD